MEACPLLLSRLADLLLSVHACFPFCAHNRDRGNAADATRYILCGACRARNLPCKCAPLWSSQVAEAPL